MAGLFGELPVILGWDVAGVVEELGFGVTTLALGDEVFGMPRFPMPAGTHAEYVAVPARQLARRPASLTHMSAAGLPMAGLTAWQALVDTAQVQGGQRVLITGAAGGVGHLAVQIAKHQGAYVIVTARTERHEWLTQLGADELIDYSAVQFEHAVSDVDVVIDLIGDARDSTASRAVSTLRQGGVIVSLPGGVPQSLATSAALRGVRASAMAVEPDIVGLHALAAMASAGALSVDIAETFDYVHSADAPARVEAGHARGKVVLSFDATG